MKNSPTFYFLCLYLFLLMLEISYAFRTAFLNLVSVPWQLI